MLLVLQMPIIVNAFQIHECRHLKLPFHCQIAIHQVRYLPSTDSNKRQFNNKLLKRQKPQNA